MCKPGIFPRGNNENDLVIRLLFARAGWSAGQNNISSFQFGGVFRNLFRRDGINNVTQTRGGFFPTSLFQIKGSE